MRRPSVDFIFFTVLFALMSLAALIGWARSAHANESMSSTFCNEYPTLCDPSIVDEIGPLICAANPDLCIGFGAKCTTYANSAYDVYASMLGTSVDITRKREPFLGERRKFIEDACDNKRDAK